MDTFLEKDYLVNLRYEDFISYSLCFQPPLFLLPLKVSSNKNFSPLMAIKEYICIPFYINPFFNRTKLISE